MKTLLALLTMISLTTVAHGEMKPKGTFVPNKCSDVKYPTRIFILNPIERLCVGKLVGYNIPAVSVIRIDESTLTYTVTEITANDNNLLTYTLEAQNGETANLNVSVSGSEIFRATGEDGMGNFVADQFETMFSTLSAGSSL